MAFDHDAFEDLAAVRDALSRQAAVALIGPRQVGKTTLAHTIADGIPSIYLDLEAGEDRAKLAEPALFLNKYEDRLLVLDEIRRLGFLRPHEFDLVPNGLLRWLGVKQPA